MRRSFRDTIWFYKLAFVVTYSCLGLAFLLLLFCRFSVVRGNSMKPSLYDGNRLVLKRLSDPESEIRRFDVVIFRSPFDPETDYIKRVVGLPGDRVWLAKGKLWINGKPTEEQFLHNDDLDTTGEVSVPKGHFFVLGDNRAINSYSP